MCHGGGSSLAAGSGGGSGVVGFGGGGGASSSQIVLSVEDYNRMAEAQQELKRLRKLYAAQDDCLIAVEDGKPVPAAALDQLPPGRAVFIARIASHMGCTLESGSLADFERDALAASNHNQQPVGVNPRGGI